LREEEEKGGGARDGEPPVSPWEDDAGVGRERRRNFVLEFLTGLQL
jgi:hypothetical protein